MFKAVLLPFLLLVTNSAFVNSHPRGRIINGTEAVPHSFPYAVYLNLVKAETGNWHPCNGILISSKYVLTSALCAIGHKSRKVKVVSAVLGVHDISINEPTQVLTTFKSVLVHPDYDYKTSTNDLALLQLENPVNFTESIQPAKLPKRSDISKTYEGQTSTTCGWGTTNLDLHMEFSDVLNTLEDVIINLEECRKHDPSDVNDDSICQHNSMNRGMGFWDLGNPLVIDGVVVGVASNGDIGRSTPFTRLDHFVDWIEENSDVTFEQ